MLIIKVGITALYIPPTIRFIYFSKNSEYLKPLLNSYHIIKTFTCLKFVIAIYYIKLGSIEIMTLFRIALDIMQFYLQSLIIYLKYF